MKKIILSRGQKALVDDCEYERLIKMGKWSALFNKSRRKHGVYYAVRNIQMYKGKIHTNKVVYMHNCIIQEAYPKNLKVFHLDGNPLNNQKSNLVLITHGAQISMVANSKRDTVGYSYNKERKRFRAAIQYKGKEIYLGSFLREESAKRAYKRALRSLYFPQSYVFTT